MRCTITLPDRLLHGLQNYIAEQSLHHNKQYSVVQLVEHIIERAILSGKVSDIGHKPRKTGMSKARDEIAKRIAERRS